MDELTAKLILLRAPLTPAQWSGLFAEFGSAAAALAAGSGAWPRCGLTPRSIEILDATSETLIDPDRRWLEQPHHHLLCLGDPDYPPLLQQLPDAPTALFVSGNVQLLSMPQLAMVGSRNPTPYGREIATAFAQHLTQCGLAITSGLADGIDAASHRGALDGSGHTIAVCGTGLDVVYPRSSTDLAQEIEQHGALISEFPIGTAARKYHFPLRNRIISGLSLGTFVVEAALHSGSLITAKQAGEYGREVFALPGSIHNPMAKGCHQLIRQGAKLVDSAEDILSELGPLTALAQSLRPMALQDSKLTDLPVNSGMQLDKDYKILLDALGFEPVGIDQLVMRSGLKSDAVASMLLILELEEHVTSMPGGLYVRSGKASAES
ncbi:MAG: DNA-processing protein DprA [Steroidobacter sp.]